MVEEENGHIEIDGLNYQVYKMEERFVHKDSFRVSFIRYLGETVSN